MKVTTDGCLFGAWCAEELNTRIAGGSIPPAARLLDIGTGTGLLALMVAQKAAPSIHALEIDEEAAAQAAANAADSPFSKQIVVIQSDVVQLKEGGYDVIISNPPFYENELKSGNKAKDTAHHSHQLTWTELFAAMDRQLKADGIFFLLLPYKRAAELDGYLEKEQFFINKIVRVRQSTRHSPFRMMVQGSRTASPLQEEELAIRDEFNQYTPAFTALLKDYYLYL